MKMWSLKHAGVTERPPVVCIVWLDVIAGVAASSRNNMKPNTTSMICSAARRKDVKSKYEVTPCTMFRLCARKYLEIIVDRVGGSAVGLGL